MEKLYGEVETYSLKQDRQSRERVRREKTEVTKIQPESRSPKLTQKLIMGRINLQLWN